MNESEIIDLLSKNGMLIKRPLITDGKTMTNGAKESVLKAAWLNN